VQYNLNRFEKKLYKFPDGVKTAGDYIWNAKAGAGERFGSMREEQQDGI
jgi:hypothetical protein